MIWSVVLGVVVLAVLMIVRGCGFDELPQPFTVEDMPDAGADANADADTSIDTRSTKAADAEDADAYSLPANSITTCGEYFACVYDCPEHVESCVGPCHDAMTTDAAAQVQALAACINSSGCQDETCMFDTCGHLLDACFNTFPTALRQPQPSQIPNLAP